MPIEITPIAHIRSPFTGKFAIPRQSNIADSIRSVVVFEPDFRNPDALRGIEEFEYIWLIWFFSENTAQSWSPTVRPPRLGGNKRKGVFATRSPFRPNSLALSSVRLLSVELHSSDGPLLHISGADILDGTPIFDIKPYLPYTDSHPEARSGFAPQADSKPLTVVFPEDISSKLPVDMRQAITEILIHDPRPQYQHDPDRIYTFSFSDLEISFSVSNDDILTIVKIK